MIPVRNLNHAVLFVRDFYRRAFGFEEIAREGGRMAFLRSPLSGNHHDLGLFAVGASAPDPPPGSVGLYHLAWQVPTIEDLAAGASTLADLDALVGQSDHGATKSLYGKDPDGNEFEVMWMLPRDQWGAYEHEAPIRPLDLAAEVARHGGART
jgi:catechol-2,3-dioxygenase